MAVRSKQPGGNHAAAAPNFRHVRKVEFVLIMFRMPKRRGFGVIFAFRVAGIGMLQNVEPLGIRRHEPVLDAVVNHFHEVPCAGRAAVQIAFFGGALALFRGQVCVQYRRVREQAS